MNVIKDFIEVIVTLSFILIFILPFLKRKKKEEMEESSAIIQGRDDLAPVTNTGRAIEGFIENIFTEEPKPQKKKVKKKKVPKEAEVYPAASQSKNVSEPAKIQRAKPHPLFASAQSLRQAIIMKEILDKPKGLE